MDRQCYFEKKNIDYIDYKDTDLLKKFLTPHAEIYGREKTGLCAQHQRELTKAIKRARYMGLIPYRAT